jgi:hypothetical protein
MKGFWLNCISVFSVALFVFVGLIQVLRADETLESLCDPTGNKTCHDRRGVPGTPATCTSGGEVCSVASGSNARSCSCEFNPTDNTLCYCHATL